MSESQDVIIGETVLISARVLGPSAGDLVQVGTDTWRAWVEPGDIAVRLSPYGAEAATSARPISSGRVEPEVLINPFVRGEAT